MTTRKGVLHSYRIELTAEERVKFIQLGGAKWVRHLIETTQPEINAIRTIPESSLRERDLNIFRSYLSAKTLSKRYGISESRVNVIRTEVRKKIAAGEVSLDEIQRLSNNRR